MSIDLKKLLIPTPKEEVKYRYIAGKRIAYVTARYVMDKLDEIVGPENWRFNWEIIQAPTNFRIGNDVQKHPGCVKGTLEINTKEYWVSKSDVGEYNVNIMSAMKTGVSDALKRCAVQYGIGRDLYSEDYGKEEKEEPIIYDIEVKKESSLLSPPPPPRDLSSEATKAQIDYLSTLSKKHNFDIPSPLSKKAASELIQIYVDMSNENRDSV